MSDDNDDRRGTSQGADESTLQIDKRAIEASLEDDANSREERRSTIKMRSPAPVMPVPPSVPPPVPPAVPATDEAAEADDRARTTRMAAIDGPTTTVEVPEPLLQASRALDGAPESPSPHDVETVERITKFRTLQIPLEAIDEDQVPTNRLGTTVTFEARVEEDGSVRIPRAFFEDRQIKPGLVLQITATVRHGT